MKTLRNLFGGKQPAGPKEIGKLVQNLQSKDMGVGVKAATALGKSQNPLAIEHLIAALEDEKHVMRGGVTVSPVAEAAEEALVQMGASAVEPLIPVLKRDEKGKDWLVRLRAATALGRIGDARAAETLVALLADRESATRQAVINALKRIGKPAREPCLAASQQESALVRIGAFEVLAFLAEPGAFESLLAGLQAGGDKEVRVQAARALGNLAIVTPQSIEALTPCLRDIDTILHCYAIESLVKLGPSGQAQVVALLNSDDHSTRVDVSQALNDAARFGNLKADPRAAQMVRSGLKASWARQKRWGEWVMILKELGDARAVQILAAVDRNDTNTISQIINSL
jgi:HEAT repeat protein